MKIFLDTNIVVDIISRRAGYENSLRVLRMCETKRVDGIVSALTITNVLYILRKQNTGGAVRDALQILLAIVDVADVLKADIQAAFVSAMTDYEDAVQAVGARRIGADLIITRNVPDFTASPIAAITPEDFLSRDVAGE